MTEITQILSQIEGGDPSATEQLLPLVYDELRKLASARLANEKPGQTLQPTDLVHEAYLRLVDNEFDGWKSRGHFFGAAAEAMRRILIDNARRKQSRKHGGDLQRIDLGGALVMTDERADQLLALNAALGKLASESPDKAELVQQISTRIDARPRFKKDFVRGELGKRESYRNYSGRLSVRWLDRSRWRVAEILTMRQRSQSFRTVHSYLVARDY